MKFGHDTLMGAALVISGGLAVAYTRGATRILLILSLSVPPSRSSSVCCCSSSCSTSRAQSAGCTAASQKCFSSGCNPPYTPDIQARRGFALRRAIFFGNF